jgi:hypothetical protein
MHTPTIPLYPYLLCLIEELEKLNLLSETMTKSILSFFTPGIQTLLKGQPDLSSTPSSGKKTTLFEGNKYREILESIGRNKRHMPDMLSFKVRQMLLDGQKRKLTKVTDIVTIAINVRQVMMTTSKLSNIESSEKVVAEKIWAALSDDIRKELSYWMRIFVMQGQMPEYDYYTGERKSKLVDCSFFHNS